jgi:hypothetical protein
MWRIEMFWKVTGNHIYFNGLLFEDDLMTFAFVGTSSFFSLSLDIP